MIKTLVSFVLLAFVFPPPCVLAQDGAPQEVDAPKPKAKLSDSDRKEFQKLFDKWLEYEKSPKRHEPKTIGRMQKALDALTSRARSYEKEKDVSSTISDDDSWRQIFANNVAQRMGKVKIPGKGSIKKSKVTWNTRGEKVGFAFSYAAPRQYTPKKKWPVIISFHDKGSDGYTYLKKVWDDDKVSKTIRDQFIFVAPHLGQKSLKERGYTVKRYDWFGTYHANAMLRPLRWILENYSCDLERIYVEGVGEGAQVALDLAALYGGNLLAGVVARQGQPRDLSLLPSLTHIPTLFLYREGGVVDVGDSKALWDDIRTMSEREGIKSFEFRARPKPEKINPRVMAGQKTEPMKDANTEVAEYLMGKTLPRYPDKIRFVTNRTHFKRCGFVQLNRVDIEGGTAECTLEVDKEKNSVIMTGNNFYSFTLFLNDSILDLDKPIEVVVNGKVADRRTVVRSFSDMLKGMLRNPYYNGIATAHLRADVPQAEEKKEGDDPPSGDGK